MRGKKHLTIAGKARSNPFGVKEPCLLSGQMGSLFEFAAQRLYHLGNHLPVKLESAMYRCFAISAFICLSSQTLLAQEEKLGPPVKQHELLKKFEGQWTTTGKAAATEGQPAVETKGSIKSRMLGKFWVVSDMSAEMSGTKFQALQTIGYDPQKQQYTGTWVDSMMNHMWHYEGRYEESANRLILEAEGPSFDAPGKTAKYRDIYEFKSPGHIVTKSEVRQGDKWITFMTGEAKRTKPASEKKK